MNNKKFGDQNAGGFQTLWFSDHKSLIKSKPTSRIYLGKDPHLWLKGSDSYKYIWRKITEVLLFFSLAFILWFVLSLAVKWHILIRRRKRCNMYYMKLKGKISQPFLTANKLEWTKANMILELQLRPLTPSNENTRKSLFTLLKF